MPKVECETCRFYDLEADEEPCGSCFSEDGIYKNWQILTRGDQIRQMDNEALSNFLYKFVRHIISNTSKETIHEFLDRPAVFKCDGKREECAKTGCYINGGECYLTMDYEHAFKNGLNFVSPI